MSNVEEAAVAPEEPKKRCFWKNTPLTPMDKLAQVEARILSSFGIKYISRFVPVSFNNSVINTVTVKSEEEETAVEPIVLIHGMGAGVALWGNGLKNLSLHHTVHAFDLLGFGRSSRPTFSKNGEEAEQEMVQSIEDWREAMEIEKMYLVAHSFGGYLASAYALKHPRRVKHLILADPWGFGERNPERESQLGRRFRLIATIWSAFNPLAALRLSGPYATNWMKRARPDLMQRYPSDRPEDIYDYIYQCNSQKPTGEAAFKSMLVPFAWARNPMSKRFHELDDMVPVTYIHGSRSWIDHKKTIEILRTRKNGFVDVQVVENAGHHVYADDMPRFVEIVFNAIFEEPPKVLGNPIYA